jgi:ATP synthase protein I
VNSPETSHETAQDPQEQTAPTEAQAAGPLPEQPDSSMQEYFKLQQDLLKVTLILTGIVFVSVWIFYSLNIALNYLIGACTGVVYLRMLARNVAQLGRERSNLGSARLALLIGVIVTASQLNQLQIMPIFLGFLTYKAAIIFYVLRTTILPDSN